MGNLMNRTTITLFIREHKVTIQNPLASISVFSFEKAE